VVAYRLLRVEKERKEEEKPKLKDSKVVE